MGDSNLINFEVNDYNKVISNIFICGWDENTIINYNQKEENIINNIKVLFSIPFNSNFNYLDVYFI
jgi:hypothetical protein